MRKHFLVSIFLFAFSLSYSQYIDYAKRVIHDLSSEKFHGRGYTHKGALKAAKYIRNELKKMHVSAFNNNYFQNFKVTVNTITDIKYVYLDDKKLNPGTDYLIFNTSSGCHGTFDVIKVDSAIFYTKKKIDFFDKFVLVDEEDFASKDNQQLYVAIKYMNILKAKGVIALTKEHPYQTMSYKPLKYTVVVIQKDTSNIHIKKIRINCKSKLLEDVKTQNVIGFIPGEVDTFIMFGAHYDHLGEMGKDAYFPGANDNASGCSMLLNLAKYYSEHKPHYSILFSFFSGEEIAISGSHYMSENPPVDLKKIKFFFNLDMVGTGDEGIKIVNGTIYKKEFGILDTINAHNHYLVKIGRRGEAKNSDHYYFYEKGVPCFFIYTLGGNKDYHNVFDVPDAISLYGFNDLFKLLRDFVNVYR